MKISRSDFFKPFPSLNIHWAEPLEPTNPDHLLASETVVQFALGWFAQPIFVDGTYPSVMRMKIDEKSQAQGFNESRLPSFTPEETIMVAQSSDFMGINFYTSELVYPVDEGTEEISYYKDDDAELVRDPNWFTTGLDSMRVTPWAIRSTMSWIKSHFPAVDVYITENGTSDKVGEYF